MSDEFENDFEDEFDDDLEDEYDEVEDDEPAKFSIQRIQQTL